MQCRVAIRLLLLVLGAGLATGCQTSAIPVTTTETPSGKSLSPTLSAAPFTPEVYTFGVQAKATALQESSHLRSASRSVTGVIRVGATIYQETLPPRDSLQYVLTQQGIVWALTTAHSGTNGIYITPYEKISGGNTVNLPASAKRLFFVQPGDQIHLFQSPNYAFFEVTGAHGTRTFEVVTHSGTAFQLFKSPAGSISGNAFFAPLRTGVIVAQAMGQSPLRVAKNVTFVDVSTLAVQPVPASWPVSVLADAPDVVIAAGSRTTTIDARGSAATSWTPVPKTVSALKNFASRSDFRGLFVPSMALRTAAQGSFTLLSPTRYSLTLSSQGQSLCTVTGVWNHASLRHSDAATPTFSTATVSHSREWRQIFAAFPKLLRPSLIHRDFWLLSKEGEWVLWLQTAPKGTSQAHWFAAFATHGWAYAVGPFTSPADRSQTQLLSQLLAFAKRAAPEPYAAPGAVSVTIGGTTPQFVESSASFQLANHLQIHMDAAGLGALTLPEEWTFMPLTHS